MEQTYNFRENVTKDVACNIYIKPILTCQINDRGYVSDALAVFCWGLGAITMSYRNFSYWIYYSISARFIILRSI